MTGFVVKPEPRQVDGAWECRVAFSDGARWISEQYLELVVEQLNWTTRDGLLRGILLAKLRNPLTDSLYAFRASRTEFEPYQFRPALRFLRGERRGLLIADEVGLGKTIEAAIIYLELRARLDISRVLVLCPSRLTAKWHKELRDRFEESFDVLDASGARRLLNEFERVGPSLPIRAIASYELLRRPEFTERLLDLKVPLDLLIVDEAHYMRNAGAATYRLGATLVDTADVSLFLTATPLHLRNQDLFNLLNLLAPEEFTDLSLFEDHVRPNEFINRASQYVADPKRQLHEVLHELRRVEGVGRAGQFLGNPYYTELVQQLESSAGEDISQRVSIQRKLMDLNTLSAVVTRTRKREVQNNAAFRQVFTVRVQLTDAERGFYDRVLGITRAELQLQHQRRAAHASNHGATPGFGAVMRERQAASCLAALREVYEESARQRQAAAIGVERSAFDVHAPETSVPVQEAATPDLLELSRRIGATDSKFLTFEETLRGALAESKDSKALVFSFFRRTLEYLRRELHDRGYAVEVIHGDVPIAVRQQIMDDFRNTDKFKVLLSSEVGAEGLDFEFCDVLVNYDLPWNPMQVEQRIGRLDRFNQKHDKIRIFNFYLEDTIETRMFQRLYDRIGLFERSIGDLEAILGEEITELSSRVLQGALSPEQEERLAIEAATRIVRRQQEQDELEAEKDALLGQGAILDQQVKDTVSSGRVISPSEVRALVATFLAEQFPRSTLVGDELEDCWTLTMDPQLIDFLQRFIARKHLDHRVSAGFREVLGRPRRFALTFNGDIARQRRLLEFVTVRHPLGEAAREYWESRSNGGTPACSIVLPGPQEEVGEGYFFVHVQEVSGVVPRVSLEPVVVLDDGRLATTSAARLLAALQERPSAAEPRNFAGSSERLSAADRIASAAIARNREVLADEVRRTNAAILARREAALEASFSAKLLRAEALLGTATDDRIRRMRAAQVHNLRARREDKLEELRRRREVTVSSELVAAGRVRIVADGLTGAMG